MQGIAATRLGFSAIWISSAAKHVAIRQNYAAMIENIDCWLGIFVEELKRRGELTIR